MTLATKAAQVAAAQAAAAQLPTAVTAVAGKAMAANSHVYDSRSSSMQHTYTV